MDLGDLLDATQFSRHRNAPSQIDRYGFRRSAACAPERAAVLMLITLTTSYRLPDEPQFEVTVFAASHQDYEWDPVGGAIHVPEE